MEIIILIGIVFFLFFIFSKKDKDDNSTNDYFNNRPPRSNSYTSTTKTEVNKSKNTYRPKNTTRRKINFNTIEDTTSFSNEDTSNLKDLKDAFTGAPLDVSLGLYKCNNCQVYYHTESYKILVNENSGMCMACNSSTIISVSKIKEDARNATPNAITLNNYKKHVGHVIEFEAYVTSVKESRRGNDFAIMFENKSWVNGFKMVFFRGSISKCGGNSYIKSLNGKTIKIRGLLVNHSRFGYEIIISDPKQIIKVS